MLEAVLAGVAVGAAAVAEAASAEEEPGWEGEADMRGLPP